MGLRNVSVGWVDPEIQLGGRGRRSVREDPLVHLSLCGSRRAHRLRCGARRLKRLIVLADVTSSDRPFWSAVLRTPIKTDNGNIGRYGSAPIRSQGFSCIENIWARAYAVFPSAYDKSRAPKAKKSPRKKKKKKEKVKKSVFNTCTSANMFSIVCFKSATAEPSFCFDQ